ncbi:MAG: iron-sulfur cluster assembly scaffold protein [Anaerolineae bacterium]|jgi:nitrogen fixation NifU-like protein
MSQSPYRERILDHYRAPRHRGELEAPDLQAEVENPVCGDLVRISLRLDDQDRVAEAAFDGKGCVLSLAAASMLTERIHGQEISQVEALTEEDVLDLLGVELGPVRVKCALLPLRALKQALSKR